MNYNLKSLYFSATGTTERIVNAVANGTNQLLSAEYNITSSKNRIEGTCFTKSDLLIVGVPVYSGRVPVFVSEYLKRVKGDNTPVVCIVVYGNRDYDDALLELKDILEARGFIAIAAGAFIGEHSYTEKVATNRPDVEDIKIAEQFGKNIISKLSRINNLTAIKSLKVKGNRPYKQLQPSTLVATPLTSETCTNCGICAKHCPVGAIDAQEVSIIDAGKCLHCFSCIKKCPVDAKHFKDETIDRIAEYLISNFGEHQRESELYI